MARFNLIQIGTLYLTDDETSTGLKAKTTVSGLDDLLNAYTGATVIPISGKPFNFTRVNDGAGVFLQLKPYVVDSDLLSDLNDLFNTALAGDSTINVVITGDTGSFDLECKPRLPKPLEFSGKFINGKIFDLSINLTVDSIN
jgi:hypothetical protein